MVIVFVAHAALTPAGRFVGVPMPVAPVVVCVMAVSVVLIQSVGVEDAAPAVLGDVTVAVVVPAELVQPLTVAVTLYNPVAAVVAPAIDGF